MDNISFSGGFLIQKPSPIKWKNIKAQLPPNKCIFEDYNANGDKFFAIKNFYDRDMLYVLLRKKVNFKFYPDINLKNRLDSYYPEEARKVVSAQTNVLDTVEQIRLFIKECAPKRNFTIAKYRWKPEDHIDKTLKALGLKSTECSVSKKDGKTYIKNGKNILAIASPNNEHGINFVYVFPKTSGGESKMFALSQGGETEPFSPLNYKEFNKLFLRNVKIDLARKRPQKHV